jgi:hypothetical protein
MRAVLVVPVCVLLVVVLVFAFGGRRTLFVSSAPGGVTSSESPSPLSLPPPRQPQEVASAIPATGGLACIQNALGGVQVFAGVTSLRIVGRTKVTATTTGFRPVPDAREIGVVFPDRYRYSSEETGVAPGRPALTTLSGFNGNELLSGLMTPRPPDKNIPKMMLDVRRRFVQQVMMRLPRELADVRLSQRTTLDAAQERLAIDAFDPDDLVATLLADPRTCIPIALQFTAPSPTGLATYRVDLSQYRRFERILIPTVLKVTKDGEPWEEEYDSEIEVNAPLSDQYFRNRGA